MGEIGRELGKTPEGILEPGQHVVEGGGERLEFAGPASWADAFVELARPDALNSARHFSERTQPALGDSETNQRRGNGPKGQHRDKQSGELLHKLVVRRPVLRHLD